MRDDSAEDETMTAKNEQDSSATLHWQQKQPTWPENNVEAEKPKAPELRPATQAEFEAFVSNFPRHLERDVICFCEPPLVQYNDFTLGNWPASVVASHRFEDREATRPCKWEVLAQDSSATSGEAKQALKAIEERLTLTYGLCCGTAPKQSVGELLAVALKMPEWETLRRATTPAPQAATTEQDGAALREEGLAEIRAARALMDKFKDPAATTASAEPTKECRAPDGCPDPWKCSSTKRGDCGATDTGATTASASGDQDRRALELANAALIAAQPRDITPNGWERHEAAINATACALHKPTSRAPAPSREAAVPQIKTWRDRMTPEGEDEYDLAEQHTAAETAMMAEIADLRAALAVRDAAPMDDDEVARLRRVVRLLGMEREVPEDDASLRGCLFSVLGMIARKLESRAALAQPAAPVVDVELPPLNAKLLTIIGEYGHARSDGHNEVEINYRWGKLVEGIKEYAACVAAARSAPVGVPFGEAAQRRFSDKLKAATKPQPEDFGIRDVEAAKQYAAALMAAPSHSSAPVGVPEGGKQ